MPTLIDKLNTADAPETENVKVCPLCGSGESEFLFWNVDRLHHLPGKFGVIKCSDCGLARLSPRPKKEHLVFYYPEEEYYSYQSSDDMFSRTSEATFGWNDHLPHLVPGGNALEVGCGSGYALNVLKQLGWKVNGIEMSHKAAQLAKELYDIDVYCGQISDAPYEPASFDYVHLSHVIEHFPDPIYELKNIAAFMKPGGVIYIEAPNIESFGQQKSGPYWLHWDSPRHLFGFSPTTLQKTVEKAGLHVDRLKTLRGNFWEWDAVYRAEEAAGKMIVDRSKVPDSTKLKWLPLRFLNRLSFVINRACGDTLGCWAVKE